MCGIFGFVGTQGDVASMVVDALRKLEYRGYDSWGVAVSANGHIDVEKRAGRIPRETSSLPLAGIGFGHTRWATHGGVTDANAHPHVDCNGRFAIIHNGIIENFRQLRSRLEAAGHPFHSETDSEVVAHLIEDTVGSSSDPSDVVNGVREAFTQLRGLNAIIVLDNRTRQLIAAKNVSPLVIGRGPEGIYIASDSVALIERATEVHYLDDSEVVALRQDGVHACRRLDGEPIELDFSPLLLAAADTSLGSYDYYLEKEIHEQPSVLRRIGRDYSEYARGLAHLIDRAYGSFLIGCGTASYAALTGSYLFSRIAHRHV